MKYWPFSVIKESPLMPPAFAWELYRLPATRTLTEGAIAACSHVATQTEPREAPGLTVVFSEDCPARRVYLERPKYSEWRDLELISVVQHGEDFFVFVDVIH